MGDYVKYKRFTEEFDELDEIQNFFDRLINDGWDIISYSENPRDVKTLGIIILAGRKRGNV